MEWKLIITLTIILILPLVFAETNTRAVDDIFKCDSIINYAKPCFNNNSYCSSSTNCNFTIFNPDNTLFINNQVATNNIANYNISLNLSCNNLGIYKVDMICNDAGSLGAATFYFENSRTGNIITTAEAIIYIVFIIGIIFTLMLSLFGAIRIPFRDTTSPENGLIVSVNDMKYLKVILIVFTYILLMFFFGVTRSITANFLFLNGAHRVFNLLYNILFAFVWPLIVLSLLFTILLYVESKKIKNALARGVPFR